MDLSNLASVLKESGDQVLNGESKLSLSTKLLKDLNAKFSLIAEDKEALCSTFQVISPKNSKVELLLDLQFLHDFVQRTVGLKLVETNSEICDQISLHKFKNLKLLELRKVPLHKLTGLQALRSQLQYIICVRCVENLNDLFVNCGGDKSQAYIWSELREAVLSYNNLESIDNSFEYVPWLQTLDISHNSISNAQAIDCLSNLKHLNLSFNHLETVPIFRKELFRNLQILILKSNYIGDLIGLLYLDNLVTLDLSCNCLIDHETLSPLSHLAALQWLNLEGNPLSFHPQHRDVTSRYLHSNTSTVKFTLDKILLTKHEKKLIGTYHPSVPNKFGAMKREHQSSISSNISDLTTSSEVTTVAASELTRSQRARKIRDAVISERDENGDIRDEEGEIINPELMKSINSVASLNVSSELVETQKKIESLRDQYGEDWLHNQCGSMMQDILGMEKTEQRYTSTPYEQDFLRHASEIITTKSEEVQVPVGTPVDSDKIDVTSDISANNTFVTASDSSGFEDNIILSENASLDGSDEEQFEEDENERPFLASLHEGSEIKEVFVVISDKYLKERDCFHARMKSKWLLEVILSCEIVSKNSTTTVCFEFDTVRRNMKRREYILSNEDGQDLHRLISNMMSQRSLSAMNQTVYCCMKCLTQFSIQKTNSKKISDALPSCPNLDCKSTLVYEVDDESTPTNHSLAQNIVDNSIERPDSPSECSIASETESNQLAQIHVTAEVHMDNNASTSVPANCSAASVLDSNCSQLSTDDTPSSDAILRKYESDIEVISNPSQSSIEVLDDQFRPGRKRSSEERRTIMQPTLVTIPDVVTPVVTTVTSHALTESSSSSSFTESVCTTYDTTHHVPQSAMEIKGVIKEETHTDAKEDDKGKRTFTSLFEGLFSGPTTGTRSAKSADDFNDIEFTYTEDFSNVDHRVKCHLYQNIFEDEHENFVWILRCVFLSLSSVQPIQGCAVLSTNKIYILHLKTHDIGDDMTKWLIKKDSYTIDRLQTVFTLPWKQGIGLEIRNMNKKNINYLCILQDMQRTSNFLAFLATNPLPDSCDLMCVYPEQPMLNLQHLLLSHQNEDSSPTDSTLCLFSVFSKCIMTKSETKTVTLGVFLVTPSNLILLPNLEWLIPESEKEPIMLASQPISNLLELNLEKSTLEFHFLDEVLTCEEIWAIQFETTDSLNTAISAVKAPWEKIFSVPMQINHKVHFV